MNTDNDELCMALPIGEMRLQTFEEFKADAIRRAPAYLGAPCPAAPLAETFEKISRIDSAKLFEFFAWERFPIHVVKQ